MNRTQSLRSDPAVTRAWKTRTAAKLAPVRKSDPGGRAWWAALSLACRERDEWQCRRCGHACGCVVAAHVVPLGSGASRFNRRDPRNVLNNLVTLCGGPSACHAQHDQEHRWTWAEIGVTPDPELVRRYGYREGRAA